VWGPSGTLLKEQGSYNLVQNRGHRGPVLRPRCIGPREGPYPICYSILISIFTWVCNDKNVRGSVAEVSILHGYDDMSLGDQLLVFQDNAAVLSSRAEMPMDEASV